MVPPAVVTRTLALPAVPAGVVQLRLVSLMTTTLLQALPPTVTALAPVKSVPLTVIEVPPAAGPALGVTVEITGTAA